MIKIVRKGCIFMNHSEQHCKCNECSCCCTKKIISTVAGCLKAHFNEIVHFIVLALLSVYVFKNWETCISMQFFSRFDGNNILFLSSTGSTRRLFRFLQPFSKGPQLWFWMRSAAFVTSFQGFSPEI